MRIIKARRMILARHVARMGEKRNAYRLLGGKPEGRFGIEPSGSINCWETIECPNN
jgi:hypothetical protein